MQNFDYSTAFVRNIGWLTTWEQNILKQKRIAIAGMGGVGGVHLLTLTRLGINNFNIADFDQFELHNFNRQVGAGLSTIGKNKTDVMMAMAKDINPELDVRCFTDGVNADNINAFLQDVDVYVDGMDAFCMATRRLLFTQCEKKGIPFITAGPIGMGVCYLIHVPGAMSVEDYFRFENLSDDEQLIRFMLGLTPLAMHRQYLQEAKRLNIKARKGPSTSMACQLCAGVAGTQVLKILLNRGNVYALPYYHVYDAYLDRYSRRKLSFGNAGIIQRLKYKFAKCYFDKLEESTADENQDVVNTLSLIEKIINLARWAPSAENTQPWTFIIHSEKTLTIEVCNKANDVFNYGGVPIGHMAGILIETFIIAASNFSQCVDWQCDAIDQGYRFQISLEYEANMLRDELFESIQHRSVNRKNYQRKKLNKVIKQKLQDSIGLEHYELVWVDDKKSMFKIARLNFRSFITRMQSKAVFDAQQGRFNFDEAYCPEGVPLKTTNIDYVSAKLFSLIHNKWKWYGLMNRYLLGAVIPGLECEFIPSVFSGAQLSLKRSAGVTDGHALITEGRIIQRLWLTATQLGLVLQPNYFPMLQQYYATHPEQCSESSLLNKSEKIIKDYQTVLPLENSVFLARIGFPKTRHQVSRSTRRSYEDLMGRA